MRLGALSPRSVPLLSRRRLRRVYQNPDRATWDEYKRAVADSIRGMRVERNWTQADLAGLARVSVGAIVRVENASHDALPLRLIWTIARAFRRSDGPRALLP